MRRPFTSRIAGQARRVAGVADVLTRLDRLEDRMGGVEHAIGDVQRMVASVPDRYPNGPVYLGDRLALVAARWGGKLVVDTTDRLLSPWLLLDGLWESTLTGWFEQHVEPGDVVVDVGANIGYFTILAGRLVGPGGVVVAVEAHPHLAELLRGNVVINGQHGYTTVWHRAAWSAPERLTFHQRAHYSANSSLGKIDEDALRSIDDHQLQVEVEGVALDELLGDLPRIDVMKIDVEGAEVRALAGLERTLRRHHRLKLLIEWSPDQLVQLGGSPAELLDVLAGHGFGLRLFEAGLERVDRAHVLDTRYGNLLAER